MKQAGITIMTVLVQLDNDAQTPPISLASPCFSFANNANLTRNIVFGMYSGKYLTTSASEVDPLGGTVRSGLWIWTALRHIFSEASLKKFYCRRQIFSFLPPKAKLFAFLTAGGINFYDFNHRSHIFLRFQLPKAKIFTILTARGEIL
jgi:hypothetical protein